MKKVKLLFILLLAIGIIPVAQAQQVRVTGQVTNSATGETLPGVTVVVKGTTSGTATDLDGKYSLDVPATATLVFSFVGMESRELGLQGRTTLNVALNPSASMLDEVVVVGYGSAKRLDLTGSITTVKAKDLAYQAVANPAQALQGKVAGVQVTNSGSPGSAPDIRIRGLGTVSASSAPLYVVDGILTNDISYLGTNDIENITFLKDASSSAIYGVRAANGVIIVTTKRSQSREARISYSGYTGFQKVVNKFELTKGRQYIDLINEKNQYLAEASGSTFVPFNPEDFPDQIDWYDEVLREKAMTQSHDVSVMGGSARSMYTFGASWFMQEGLVKGHDYDRINIRSSLESEVLKNLKVGYSANLSTYKFKDVPGVFYNSYIAPPVFTAKINDTTFNPMGDGVLGNFANPAAQLYYHNSRSNGIRFLGNAFAELKIAKNFRLKSSYGIDYGSNQNRSYIPYFFVSETQFDTTSRTLSRSMAHTTDGFWDNTLTYDNTFGKHKITAMAGVSAQEFKSLSMFGSRNYVNDYGDHSLYIGLGDQTTSNASDGGDKITSLSYFGRATYNYMDKYLFTGTLRYDGSSVFPKDQRWDIFPSAGLGWVISNEDFMQMQNIFDFLKFRASWGLTGNNRIPSNIYTLTIAKGGQLSTAFGEGGNVVIAEGANITTAVPPLLKWEKVREVDVAFEGLAADNKLSFELDYYHRLTIDGIFPTTLSATAGTSGSYLQNNGNFLNSGVELTLGWTDKAGDLNYAFSTNFTYNKNEVKELLEGTLGLFGGNLPVGGFFSTYTIVGEPIGSYYGRNVLGIFQNQEQIDTYTWTDPETNETVMIQPNAKPGDFIYEDVDNNGLIDAKDRVFMGSALPTYLIGFNATFEYKGFDLSFDLYAQGGNKIYNAKRAQRLGNENYDLDFYENHWHGEGTSNNYPSADLTGDNMIPNNWYIEPGAFFRIRNIQLGYSLPEKALNTLGIRGVRFYINTSNPFTFFKYNGFSPEISSSSPTSQGIDLNVYPMSATYNFGVNVNF
ncbi:MAG TPA: TonB-dependent receptor [Lentimicrobium sp.]|nr:TonB-dependent receptor [Lentimicrobium sp.]